jgi:hypothetical protein
VTGRRTHPSGRYRRSRPASTSFDRSLRPRASMSRTRHPSLSQCVGLTSAGASIVIAVTQRTPAEFGLAPRSLFILWEIRTCTWGWGNDVIDGYRGTMARGLCVPLAGIGTREIRGIPWRSTERQPLPSHRRVLWMTIIAVSISVLAHAAATADDRLR